MIDEKIKDTSGIAYTLLNIGHLIKKNNSTLALENYNKSLKFLTVVNDRQGIAYALNNLGLLYNDLGDFDKALECHFKSLKIREEISDKLGISYSNCNIGKVYLRQSKINEAFQYAVISMKVAKESNSPENILAASQLLKLIYIRKGDFKKALEMTDLFIDLSFSIEKENSRKIAIQKEFQYAYEKKAAADSVRVVEEKKVAVANLKQEESKRYALYVGLVLVLLFSAFLFNRFKVTKRQKEFIEFQKGMVDEK